MFFPVGVGLEQAKMMVFDKHEETIPWQFSIQI